MADTTTTSDKGSATTKVSAKASSPDRWQVKLSHPLERKRTVFSSVSEKRARAFLQNRYPRGEEAYLEGPDGYTESYQQERTGEHGEDAEPWQAFDPEAYVPPEEAAPVGEAAWADVES
jgi:hypothetical protein